MSTPDITLTLNPRRQAQVGHSTGSLTDEEDSSGTGVHLSPASAVGSQDSLDKEYTDLREDYDDSGWDHLSRRDLHDIGSSEAPSRPGTSNHHRSIPEAPRPEALLRQTSRREASHVRLTHRPVHRAPQPSSSESVDSNEELYADLPRHRRYQWVPATGGQSHQYAPSYTTSGYAPYPTSSIVPAGQQLVPFASPQLPYGYSPYQQVANGSAPGYYSHGHPAAQPHLASHMSPQGAVPYGSADMMHHPNVPSYFPYPPQPYSMPHAIAPAAAYPAYPPVFTPPAVQTPPPPSTAPAAEPPKPDEGYARLEKIIMDEKADREAREAAAKAAAEAAKAQAEVDKKHADEIAAAASAAAAAATTEAEKKAADKAAEDAAKAAEEAAKAKAEAEKAKAEADKAAADAAAAAPPPPPPEKKKPIKFKDAVGRKFSFPFDLCCTWEGMEDLIRQAFAHVDVIGPHVAEGHYDLLGPNNEIILPRIWDSVVEPDWTITMHMWPMPEPPKIDELAIMDVATMLPPPPEEKKNKGRSRRKAVKSATSHPPPPPPPPFPPFGDDVIDVPPFDAPPPPPPAPFLDMSSLAGGLPAVKSNASSGKKKARTSIFGFGAPRSKPKAKAIAVKKSSNPVV